MLFIRAEERDEKMLFGVKSYAKNLEMLHDPSMVKRSTTVGDFFGVKQGQKIYTDNKWCIFPYPTSAEAGEMAATLKGTVSGPPSQQYYCSAIGTENPLHLNLPAEIILPTPT